VNRNLDVLRAVAVLCVLVSHLRGGGLHPEKLLSVDRLGHVGVLLFFVHTSLVLLMSLQKRPGTAAFYVRRIFRIYPLSVFTVVLVLLVKIPYVPNYTFLQVSTARIFANLLLIQGGGRSSIIGPLWSLPHEMLMYAFLPLVFLALRKNNTMSAALALWFASATIGTTIPLVLGFDGYWLAYIPCFLCGAIAYRGTSERAGFLAPVLFPCSVAALIAGYVILGSTGSPDLIFREYLFCLLIGLMLPLFREMSVSAVTKAAHYVAKYSYGIYLLHFPIMWLAFYRLSVPMAARWAVFALLMVAGPVLAYHLLEAPMVEVGRKLASRRPVPAPQLVLVAATPD
jgi:peptidoglycan/LPS O-acetylase OafA/YrhL